jgi:hypothetical protein
MPRTGLIKSLGGFGVRVLIHSGILAAASTRRVGTVERTLRQPGNGAVKAGWRAGTGVIFEDIL